VRIAVVAKHTIGTQLLTVRCDKRELEYAP